MINKIMENFANILFKLKEEPKTWETDEEPMSNCCTAPFTEPGWPDSDFCSECHEHAAIDEDE